MAVFERGMGGTNDSVARRITRLTTLLILATGMLVALAASAQAQPTDHGCATVSSTTGRTVDLALSAAVVTGELRTMSRSGAWRTMTDVDAGAVAADPSSHLHALGSYHLARRAGASTSCATPAERADLLRGAAWALSIGVAKEVIDGWYTGFSTVDLAMDAAGVGYAVLQGAVPAMRHVTPTFSVSPQLFSRGVGNAVTNYGEQTVWMSANVHELLPTGARAWPRALRLSAGRRAYGNGQSSDYVVGLDIDAAALPGTHPAWVRVKHALHHVRLPGPAFVMRGGRTSTRALYW